MNLTDLEALLWLARAGSLQAAALASGVPRTTLRRRLDRLRLAVGEPLATSGSSGVILTPAGEVLVERAPALLADRRALLNEAQRAARQPTGPLRMLLASGFPPAFVAQVIASIAAAVPGFRLELQHDARPLERLGQGFDIVVHWGDPPPPRDGYSRVMLRQPLRLMAAPTYLERRGLPRALGDLEGHDLLGTSSAPDAWPLLAGGEFPIHPAHTVDDLYLLGCLAGAGAGIALLPRSGVGLDPSVQALVPVLEEIVGAEQIVRVFLPIRTVEGGASRSVLDAILTLWGQGGLPDPP